MHTISDNMLVDVALLTQPFVGVLPCKYYDMREFDRILFLIDFSGHLLPQSAQVAIVMDDTGTGTTNKVLKTFADTPLAVASAEVWAVEVKAEDLEDGLPFVRIDTVKTLGQDQAEAITVVAALCSPHQTHVNKLGAEQVFKSWE